MSDVTFAPPAPKLVLLDTTVAQQGKTGLPNEIQFKYLPIDFTMDVGSAYGQSTGMNRDNPILQFSHGEQQQFTFGMRLWADDSTVNIDDQLQLLKDATQKNLALKRPPRWQFIWGKFINETVVIKSIGGIKFDTIRSDGSIRGLTLNITLLLYQSIDIALLTSEDRLSDTFFTVSKRGDLWEDVALREYDDPMLGELLRRQNPDILFPGDTPGKIIKLPKLQNIRNLPIEPDSIPLRRTADGLALRAQMYAARSKPRSSTVLKT